MAVRIRYHIEASVSSDSSEAKDLGQVRFEVVSDDHGEGGTWKTTLGASASDVEIRLDNIAAARMILIRTNAKDVNETPVQVDVKRNTIANEALPIVPLDSTKEGHLLWSTDSLSALYATNTGAIDMELTVMAIGD